MTSLGARLMMLTVIVSVHMGHQEITGALGNTPTHMLLFHGSAMLCDWLILWLVAPILLQGRVLDLAQWLSVSMMIGNLLGWLLYMDFAPPSIYNAYMWVLTVAQWACLFIPDRTDENNSADHLRVDMVRHRYFGGSGNNTRTEKS